MTLQQWLVMKEITCALFTRVRTYSDQRNRLENDIINAIFNLHSNGSFYGFLCYLENVTLHVDEIVIGGNPKKIKPVSLIHTNVIQKPKIDVHDENEIHLGIKNDKSASLDLIFKNILQRQYQ